MRATGAPESASVMQRTERIPGVLGERLTGSPIPTGGALMQGPIDTSAFSFMGALPPEPVLDHQTRQQKTGVHGGPLYCMELMCVWDEGADVLTVSFPGAPLTGLAEGT